MRDRGDKLPIRERRIVVGGVKSLGASFPGINFCVWGGILFDVTLRDVSEAGEELQIGLVVVVGVGSRGVESWSPSYSNMFLSLGFGGRRKATLGMGVGIFNLRTGGAIFSLQSSTVLLLTSCKTLIGISAACDTSSVLLPTVLVLAKDFNPLPWVLPLFISTSSSLDSRDHASEHSPHFRSQFREYWWSTSSHSPHLMP